LAVFAQVIFELLADFWNRRTDATAPAILKAEVLPCDVLSALWICCAHPRSAMRRLLSGLAPDAALEGAPCGGKNVTLASAWCLVVDEVLWWDCSVGKWSNIKEVILRTLAQRLCIIKFDGTRNHCSFLPA
jgi:hypothetical protein